MGDDAGLDADLPLVPHVAISKSRASCGIYKFLESFNVCRVHYFLITLHLIFPTGTYYWVRKAVVILGPAYILACMFEAMEPPEPLIRHAWDDIILALGKGPRVSSAAELKARGVGRRPELR